MFGIKCNYWYGERHLMGKLTKMEAYNNKYKIPVNPYIRLIF